MDTNEIIFNTIKDFVMNDLTVRDQLTGDYPQDRQTIFNEIVNCNSKENSEMKIFGLRELFNGCFTNEEISEFRFISEKTNFVNNLLIEVIELQQSGKLKEALIKLDEFFYSYPFLFKDTDYVEYHHFSNYIEEHLFYEDFDTEKQILPIHNYGYLGLCYIYGALLYQFKRYGESAYFLDLTSKLNPVLTTALFERGEIFKLKRNFQSFLEYTNKALRYSYSPQNLARGYRNLGYYYIEIENLELATAIFNFSLFYEVNEVAYNELQYINSLGYNEKLNSGEILNLLQDNNIQIGPSDLVFNTINKLIRKFEVENNFDEVLELYKLLYELTKDEQIKSIISDIETNL